jgi:hypothetical protein
MLGTGVIEIERGKDRRRKVALLRAGIHTK